MTEIGKQLITAVSSIRVADRISSLIRSNESNAKGSGSKADGYRIAVQIAPVQPSTANPPEPPVIGKDFKLILIDKKTSEHVHFVVRSWPIIKQVVLFVRGVAPKLDVPPFPSEAAGTATALVAEERRKYLQTYVNTALQNTVVSNLKEFLDLIGVTEYLSIHAHDPHSITDAATSGSPRVSTSSQSASPQERKRKDEVPEISSVPSMRRTAPVLDHQKRLQECFRVLDVSRAGYLTSDDMKTFFEVMIDVDPRAKSHVQKLTQSVEAMAATDFATAVARIARETGSDAGKWVDGFHAVVFAEIYAALGGVSRDTQGSEERREYDPTELKALQFVFRVSGIRMISESEIEKEGDVTLPVSADDFGRLMRLFVNVCSLDDVVHALEKGTSRSADHSSKLVALVCSHAATTDAAKKAAVRSLQEAINELGGGNRRLGKCGNCEAAEQRLRAMKLRVSELETENSEWQSKVLTLEDQLAVKEHDFAVAASQATTIISLEDTVASLRQELELLTARNASLETRLKEVEESLENAPELSQAISAAAVPSTIIEVVPEMSNSEARLFDSVGPITVPFGTPGEPSGPIQPAILRFDVFLTCDAGCEYLSCRDSAGRRSLCLRLEDGVMFVAGGVSSGNRFEGIRLPLGKWCRCAAAFDWSSQVVTVSFDGAVAWKSIPFRCRECESLQLMDIYPRRNVLICYSNLCVLY